jgi:hypothetical protein
MALADAGVPLIRAGPARQLVRLLQFAVEAALEVLGDQRPLGVVALVDERQPERQRRVLEDLDVLGPGDDGARRHQRRQVARREALARELGHGHHRRDELRARRVGQRRHARLHDGDFFRGRQVVERGDDVPAVDLRVVQALRAVVQAVEVAQAHRVGRGEQAKERVRAQHLVLVHQRELAVALQDALDDEHHVGPARVVFVEDQRHGPLQRPGHDAFLELGDLLAFAQHHGVLADEVEPADVAVEVQAHAGPVQPRRHLLDVGRLAGAVQALHHHAPVAHEAREDGERHVGVEAVDGVDLGHVVVAFAEGGHLQVGVDAEHLAHAEQPVRAEFCCIGHGEAFFL